MDAWDAANQILQTACRNRIEYVILLDIQSERGGLIMNTYHILIVEDDKEIREGIEIYLKNQGYIVFQAADGIEGLAQIEKRYIWP